MTEKEWLSCTDPQKMLEFLRGKTSERKLELFVGGCCVRSTKGYSIPEWDTELKALVSLGLGEIEADEFQRRIEFRGGSGGVEWAMWRAERSQREIALEVVLDEAGRMDWSKIHSQGPEESQAQCRLLRDIFNPFRSVTTDPSWRTPTVTALAKAIYEDRLFDRLPILADALEEAGCTNPDILAHFRHPGVHVRGCWALDLILGRE